MLQKIVFQDNIFQITRALDVIIDGMKLDLSEEIFAKKTMNDILFFDFAIQNIFNKLEPQTHLPDYLNTMQCLYFCIVKYTTTLQIMMNEKQNDPIMMNNMEKLMGIFEKYKELIGKIDLDIQESDVSQDSINMVSQNELSELLNFG